MNLITGATGIVGTHLLGVLIQNQQKCFALYRKDSKREKTEKFLQLLGISSSEINSYLSWIQADLSDSEALAAALQPVDQVYHCAACVSFAPKDDVELLDTNVNGTATLVDLALRHSIKKLAFVSSIAALGAPKNEELVDEKTPWNPETPQTTYAWSKYLSEMEVWRGQEEGLSTVIVNPGIILTNAYWRRSSGAFTQRAKNPRGFYPPAQGGFVTAHDVSRALFILMESEVQGERFILVSTNKAYKEVLQSLAAPWKHQGPQRKLSKFWVWGFYYLEYCLSLLRLKKRILSKGLIDSLFSTTHYNGGKIEDYTSFRYTEWELGIKQINAQAHWGNR